MSITANTRVLYDGPRKAVVQSTGITVVGANPNNLSLVTLVDPKLLSPTCLELMVARIQANVSYGVLELYWDAATPSPLVKLSGDKLDFDYTKFTGISPPPEALNFGKILMSTVGFDISSSYTITVDLVKNHKRG